MKTVFILCLLVTLLYLVSCCELKTHYMKDVKCCKKCGPGKRMLVDDNCEDPRCQDCKDGEYQDDYTSKTKCERQPSCDTIRPKKIKCQCEDGYYCMNDDDCDVCRKHTVCKPGQRVIKKGSPVSDTVCEACKNGTFSTHDSADTCQTWTICDYGYDKNAPGSSTSDRICLDGTPAHRFLIGGIVAAVFIIILGAVAVCIVKTMKVNGNRQLFGSMFHRRKKHKGYKWWTELPKQAEKITGLGIRRLHEDTDVEKAHHPLRQQQPEEDYDDSTPVSPTPSNMTDNGHPVQQEHGKESVSSHPETNSSL